jgi:hypothetical protein
MLDIRTGDKVKLEPISEIAKEKTIHKEEKWVVEAITERVFFENKTGVWLGLRIASNNNMEFRWVHLTDDEHFKVIH